MNPTLNSTRNRQAIREASAHAAFAAGNRLQEVGLPLEPHELLALALVLRDSLDRFMALIAGEVA